MATVPLPVYGDESYDAHQNVYAVSGVVGTEEDWRSLVAAWDSELGDDVFHASDWESRYSKHHDTAKHRESLAQYKRLTQLICGSPVAAFCVGLDMRRYREAKPDAPEGAQYFLCVNELFRACLQAALRVRAVAGINVVLGFTFDRHEQNEKHLSSLYELVAGGVLGGAQTSHNPLGPLGFDSRANRRIQVADLVARESMKEAERLCGYSTHPLRKSFSALLESGRLNFGMRDPLVLAGGIRENEKEWLRGFYECLHENNRRMPDGTLADNRGNRIEYGSGTWPNEQGGKGAR